jgi:hypothetical protein
MLGALKAHLVPALTARGFTGSFPHFRRLKPDQIDLLSVQFDKYGGGFVVELAKCPADGITTLWGAKIPPDKVKASDTLPPRLRLGSNPAKQDFHHWFRYDGGQSPDEVARHVVVLLAKQADPAWAGIPEPDVPPSAEVQSKAVTKRRW